MTSPEARRFAKLVAEHEKRLTRLESGGRATQLDNSSIEDGNVNSYDADGNLRQTTGKQSDGRFAVTYANGPAPPKPAPGEVSARELGVVVGVGTSGGPLFANGESPPSDLQRFDVHSSETSGYTPDGTTVIGSIVGPTKRGVVGGFLDAQTHYIKVVAVNTSQVESVPSDEVAVTPLPATNLAVTDDIIIEPGGRLIAGNPDADRIQLGSNGLRQFDEDGDATVIIGSNPGAGNTLTVRGTPSEIRRNLCSNPKLDNDAAGWDGSSNLTPSRVDGSNLGTGWAWRGTGTGVTGIHFLRFIMQGLSGKTVAFQFATYSSSAVTLELAVGGQDPQGNALSVTVLNSHAFAAGESTVLSGVLNVPDDMVEARPHVRTPSGVTLTSSDFFEVSLCCIEQSPVVRPYFDGDSTLSFSTDNSLSNPDFEQGVSGWTVTGGTLVQSTTQAHSGTYSGEFTPDGATRTPTVESARFPVLPGSDVPWTTWFYFEDSSNTGVGVYFRWFDVDQNFLSQDNVLLTSSWTSGVWVSFDEEFGIATPPAGAAHASMLIERPGTPATTDVVYLDDLVAVGASTDQTSEAQWSATPGNSMSSIVTPPTMTRTNLQDNPKLDNNANGWSALRAGSTSRVDGSHLGTSWAFRLTYAGGNSDVAMTMGAAAVTPLETYVHAGTFSTSYDGLPLRLYVDWYTDSDLTTFLGPEYTQPTSMTANTARELSATFTAPASCHWVIYYAIVFDGDPPSGNTLDGSLSLFEHSDRFDGYFDGDSDNADWKGTAGNSESVIVEAGQFENETRASLSDEGTLTVQSLETGSLTVNGSSLSDLIDPRAGRVLANSGRVTDDSPHTTSEIGWFEVGYVAPPGRQVEVSVSVSNVRSTGSGNSGIGAFLRYTEDGTTPEVNSPALLLMETSDNGSASHTRVLRHPANSQVRLLLTAVSFTGVEMWLDGGEIVAKDAGPERQPAYVLNSGGGGGVAPAPEPAPQQYNTHWRATAGQTWNQHGFRVNGECYQGFYPDGWNGDNKSIFFFDWANIQSTLAGSTIDYIDIFVYFHHWYYNSGGTAVFGYSNKPSPGGAYEIFDWGIAEYHVGKGAGRWCALPRWMGDGFRDDWIKTINLDSAFKGHDLVYYGIANWDAILSIGYTK